MPELLGLVLPSDVNESIWVANPTVVVSGLRWGHYCLVDGIRPPQKELSVQLSPSPVLTSVAAAAAAVTAAALLLLPNKGLIGRDHALRLIITLLSEYLEPNPELDPELTTKQLQALSASTAVATTAFLQHQLPLVKQ